MHLEILELWKSLGEFLFSRHFLIWVYTIYHINKFSMFFFLFQIRPFICISLKNKMKYYHHFVLGQTFYYKYESRENCSKKKTLCGRKRFVAVFSSSNRVADPYFVPFDLALNSASNGVIT